MTPKEFFDSVVKMRHFQQRFFRSKGQDKEALCYAKDYERIIDNEIKRVELIERERLQPRINFENNETI